MTGRETGVSVRDRGLMGWGRGFYSTLGAGAGYWESNRGLKGEAGDWGMGQGAEGWGGKTGGWGIVQGRGHEDRGRGWRQVDRHGAGECSVICGKEDGHREGNR